MSSNFWVFGYGSLIWRPGFEYSKSMVGQIKGYSRRFYQGSDVHRGTPDRLGRVVTLIENKDDFTWGKAFMLQDKQTALMYLGQRESSIGGYTTILTHFYPRDPKEKPFLILVYIAMPNNPLYVGPSLIPNIAKDIAFSEGQCGHNVEYLAKLVAFMKIELPSVTDDHLYSLENHVRIILKDSNFQVQLKLFDEAIEAWLIDDFNPSVSSSSLSDDISGQVYDEKNDNEFKFVDSVTKRKLRCIKKF